MTPDFTDDEIDALGERLRRGASPDVREAYGDYMGFLNELRIGLLAELRGLAPGYVVDSRLKRVETVAAKLWRRPELRLSQMPDVVGCRVIVPDRASQIEIVERMASACDVLQLDDKGDDPKFGYRAVHLDIRYGEIYAEIQVQTRNQHLWQMVSEQVAGYDISIKYGGGHPEVSRALLALSELAWQCDAAGTELPAADVDRVRDVILSVYGG